MIERDPENATISDVFRLVHDMRAEMREGFKAASEERQAIRDVVDNDFAGQGQVMQLEGKLAEVQKTLRQHGKKIDALTKGRA